MKPLQNCLENSGEDSVTSSNIVEIKQLRSMLKYSAEQLDYISISAADARKELLKCKKILKPKTCTCNCTCPCQSYNELDLNLRDIQEIVQACNFNNHISAIENTLRHLPSAYRSYKSAHGNQWNISYIATFINFLDQSVA